MSLEQMHRTRALEMRVAKLEERLKEVEERLSAPISVVPQRETLTLNREKSRTLSAGR